MNTVNPSRPDENSAFEGDVNILIVDDQPENLRLLLSILQKEGYIVRPALNGEAALKAVLHTPADLILLDIRMPEMDGFEVCRRLKQNNATRHIPVIFISAADNTDNKIAGFQAGGVDYITKPFQPDEIVARIRIQLELMRTQRALKQAYQNMEQTVRERTAELTAANEALRASEEKFRTLNENLPLGIFRTLFSGRILSANQALANILGVETSDETMKTSITAFYTREEDRKYFFDAVKSDRNVTGYEVRMKKRDGTEFEAAISARIVIDPKTGEEYIDGVLEDISDKKNIEERNKLLEKQIHQAQKMEAIGTLAGGIAHDFNNILSAVLGFTELAKLGYANKKDISKYLNQVFAAGLRARELVSQILTFSRHSDIQRTPILITPLVKESMKFLHSSLPVTIEIRQQIERIDKTVYADPTQIHQIVMNLCTNAAHAMKGKGILDVYLTKIMVDSNDYKALSPGEYIRLTVSDTGHGIEPAILHRIFEPFFTTKKIGEGTGMGLSMVHGIIKNMRGDISVYSEVGKGTTFNVLLPVYEGMEQQPAPVEIEAPVTTGSGTVLLVDDEQMILQTTGAMLQSLGYEVEAEADSRDALECFKSAPGRFDLVMTDLTMPELTGLELTAEIRRISPDIPILLCTGFSTGITEQARVETGINKILMKPILKKELATAVKEVLDTARAKV